MCLLLQLYLLDSDRELASYFFWTLVECNSVFGTERPKTRVCDSLNTFVDVGCIKRMESACWISYRFLQSLCHYSKQRVPFAGALS
jgi:hypothetical protein